MFLILIAFNRSCETACFHNSCAEMKVHIRTNISLASFLLDLKATRVSWGKRLWAVIDMPEGGNQAKYQIYLEIGHMITEAVMPTDVSINVK